MPDSVSLILTHRPEARREVAAVEAFAWNATAATAAKVMAMRVRRQKRRYAFIGSKIEVNG